MRFDLLLPKEGIDPKAMTGEEKVKLLKEMGFQPLQESHTYDCPAGRDSGYICNCVPNGTLYAPPTDVTEFLHETWEERLAASKKRKGKE